MRLSLVTTVAAVAVWCVEEVTAAAPTGVNLPRGLLGARAARNTAQRPGWGRDYGPELGLPHELVKNPFPKKKAAEKINPLATPVADQVNDLKDPTKQVKSEVNISRVVKPAPATNKLNGQPVGTSDESEKVEEGADDIATLVDPSMGDMPKAFPGGSCRSVCTHCAIAKAELGGHGCYCSATCDKGGIGGKCGDDSNGWTNNGKSRVRQEWTATCGHGGLQAKAFNCTECIPERAVGEIDKCLDLVDKSICLHELRLRYKSGVDVASWCTHESLPSCQEFVGEPEGWTCFQAKLNCELSKRQAPEVEDVAPSHSVWRSVGGGQF